MDTPQNQFHPLDPVKDLFLFIDARSISAEHRRGWVNDEVRHSGRRRSCPACRERAMWALLAFAGRARANGWNRREALTYLEEHPAIYDSDAREGIRRDKTSSGRLAKPMKAAENSTYQKAIRAAANRGELDVPTAVATEVLGWVIRFVQDEFATPTGEVVEWNRLEADMDWDHETPAWVVWSQIVQACKKAPPAQKMLDKHVYSWSAHLAAPVMHSHDESGQMVDQSSKVTDDESVTASEVTGFERLVERLVLRLEKHRTTDRAQARAWAERILFDTYGPADPSPQLEQILDLLVTDAVHITRIS